MVHADYSNLKSGDFSKEETLQHVLDSYKALETDNWVANLSNCSSLLWHAYKSLNINVNRTGFYLTVENKNEGQTSPTELILGPFQGKVACQLIKFGHGVCGTAASKKLTQLVPDVEKFPGHIACDGETKSEIVVPIVKNGETKGVIDLDCLDLEGFDKVDQEYLEKLAELIAQSL